MKWRLTPQRPATFLVLPRSHRHLLMLPLIILVTSALGVLGYWISDQYGLRSLSESGARQMELNARALEIELNQYRYLPSVLELETSVSDLLAWPDGGRRGAVNTYLEGLQRRSGARVIYVLDPTGRVQATSNWRDTDSFLGEDLSFRPYFKDAIRGQTGRYYGIGTTTGEPGYYLAHGLEDHGRIIGVAVIKVRLEAMEERWKRARLEAFVSDENGIIILSSDPARRLKSIYPLNEVILERLARSLQYYWYRLTELEPVERETLAQGVERLSLVQTDDSGNASAVAYLAQSRVLPDTQWRFTLLTPLREQRHEAMIMGTLVGVAFALMAFLFIAWKERRKVLATRLAAREALEEANNLLEKRIAERTADLRASNERLRAQIRERRHAEETLRQAQDELVRAGKLAAIGQMSTSIAHELNQPLAALRTLSGNTVRFLERGALDVASTNLRTINDLVDRMGRITASLRAFARRGDDHGQASVGSALDAALQVLDTRLVGVQVARQVADARVGIDQTRLEQVLGNLIGNALDAMAGVDAPCLTLHGQALGEHYCLRVQDNGHGVDEATRQHLFEPFFTTKPGEQGLGLGLTLSASLAAAAGGELALAADPGPGATFVLRIPLLPFPTLARPSP
ncbi:MULTISPECIES: ATP-binding protein [unclassified Pseudomonas]|uniref:sensor histidine kinase n=1 Tax=unclassified Pseudomonas TaxID=196821 RepID=UPI000BC86B0F|nr:MULTISPECIES: ATP-binding protein [unclassified Pseudomonas]PVZ09250.1 two-component system sensor histidine kinase AauS [Pseudomonas sp. URIL14HWK12:I12]PVZ21305.1 two-component system sensor histidine kinase AauS [Pseudomonas sp. URIL14HWK12:I10]PVZ30158.1 two-component system sensor histidine kinase AauS [Pseudomonas sp. URIL14HWK12:I11]SNZ18694.1 two-component system, sensor histidine kinase AauS [Pseudomonas sp. URIL14HWK12:I9]